MASARDVFSESTFAFAAINELSRLDPWWSTHVPIIPSLRRERRGGYDVRFDLPASVLLIQYKRTSEVSNLRLVGKARTSTQIVQELRTKCRDGLYQFWTTDHQHRLLDRIARKFPHTYYVAPKFTKLADLQAHFAARTLMSNSVIVKLSDFPPVLKGASGRHRVISPHHCEQNFVFSKPFVSVNVSFAREFRGIWKEWSTAIPFRQQLAETWEAFPRIGKGRAMLWARNEVTLSRSLPRLRPESGRVPEEVYSRALPRFEDETTAVVRAPTPRPPPWPPSTFRNLRQEGFIEHDESDLIKLLALAHILDQAGLTMSLLQPSSKALYNSAFYDDR